MKLKDMTREELAAYHRDWYLRNREVVQARSRARYYANKDQIKSYALAYAESHREERKAYIAAYNQAHREEHIAKVNEWRRLNPEKAKRNSREYVIRRRARLKNLAGFFEYPDFLKKCEYFGWKCIYCGKSLTEQTVTVDHRTPISRDGSNWLANLAPACKPCNSQKWARTETEFRQVLQGTNT